MIDRPSEVKDGWMTLWVDGVIASELPPSGLTKWTIFLPSLMSTNAILRPSGDQAGSS
jgi:hypothetical protein